MYRTQNLYNGLQEYLVSLFDAANDGKIFLHLNKDPFQDVSYSN